jgi:CysZ protein
MSRIFSAIAVAFVNLLHPRMLWLMVWPILVAAFAWGLFAFLFWTRAALWLAEHFKRWVEVGVFFLKFDSGDAMLFAAHIILVLLFVPAVYLTALMILSIFGMSEMVEHVARRRFPQLERRKGGSIAGSLWNGVVSLGGMVVLGIVTLPLWVFPPLWPVIPVGIFAWVNQQVLRYDALSEHASAEEMKAIFAANRKALFVMGLLLAVVAFVPLAGVIAPVLFGLAFINFLLAELQARRQAPIEGEIVREAVRG